jgi:hypothetical protein
MGEALFSLVFNGPDYVQAFIGFLGISYTGLVLISAILKLCYGRELLLGSAYIEINAQSVPDDTSKLRRVMDKRPYTFEEQPLRRVITLDAPLSGAREIRHGIYNHPECALLVGGWAVGIHGEEADLL